MAGWRRAPIEVAAALVGTGPSMRRVWRPDPAPGEPERPSSGVLRAEMQGPGLAAPASQRGLLVAARTAAVSYLRVSTDIQVERGMGLEVQRDEIAVWARQQRRRLVL